MWQIGMRPEYRNWIYKVSRPGRRGAHDRKRSWERKRPDMKSWCACLEFHFVLKKRVRNDLNHHHIEKPKLCFRKDCSGCIKENALEVYCKMAWDNTNVVYTNVVQMAFFKTEGEGALPSGTSPVLSTFHHVCGGYVCPQRKWFRLWCSSGSCFSLNIVQTPVPAC